MLFIGLLVPDSTVTAVVSCLPACLLLFCFAPVLLPVPCLNYNNYPISSCNNLQHQCNGCNTISDRAHVGREYAEGYAHDGPERHRRVPATRKGQVREHTVTQGKTGQDRTGQKRQQISMSRYLRHGHGYGHADSLNVVAPISSDEASM